MFLIQTQSLPTCQVHLWTVQDRPALVIAVARCVAGQADHVEAVLRGLGGAAPALAAQVRAQAIAELTVTSAKDIEHRDGWVFQMISWMAAWQHHGGPNSLFALPQVRTADKGFDHLFISLGAGNLALSGLIVGEDKATPNARQLIQQEAWPDIKAVAARQRDRELQGELVLLLRQHFGPGGAGIQQVIDAVIARNQHSFRVAVTATPQRVSGKNLAKLYAGFDDVAPAATNRFGEALVIPDVRPWLNDFCNDVALCLGSGRV